MGKKTIGEFIGILRKAKGMTQQELADCLNISNKAVSRWERGESAPDLTLIPVIAELFGVTTDELLRGEKNADGTQVCATTPKSEQQVKILVGRSMGAYTIKTVVSVLLVVMGYIAGMLVIYGLRQFLPGIGLIAICIISSIAFQVIALVQARTALAVPGMEHLQTTEAQVKIWSFLLWVIYINVFAIASLVPLWSAYKGQMAIPFSDFWIGGLASCLLATFLICLAISIIVPRRIIKKEGLPDALQSVHKANSRLKLACLGVCAAMVVATVFLSSLTPINTQMYAAVGEGRHFDTFEEFKEYAETPVADDDAVWPVEERYDPETDTVTAYITSYEPETDESSGFADYIEDAQGNIYPFMRRNKDVASYDYDKGTMTGFTVWSRADAEALGKQADVEAWGRLLLYLSEIIGVALFYLWKRNKLFEQYRKQA